MTLGENEDEFHFVFYCSLCDDLIATLFSKMPVISDESLTVDDYEKPETVFSSQCNVRCEKLCSCGTNVLPLQWHF